MQEILAVYRKRKIMTKLDQKCI